MRITGSNNIDYFKVRNITDVAYVSELCGGTFDQYLSFTDGFSPVDGDLSVLI